MSVFLRVSVTVFAAFAMAACSANGGFPGVGRDAGAASGDDDGDGVANSVDLCPGTAAGAPVDANGCSADQTPQDEDGDGVPDGFDLCPGTAEGAEVDSDGCAADQSPPDEDGDGVLDGADLCPGTPADTPVNAFGCSEEQVTGGPIALSGNYACAERSSGVTSTSTSGNACELGLVTDPVLGIVTGKSACYVTDPDNVVDQDEVTYAQMGIDLAVLDLGFGDPLDADVGLTVDLPGQRPGGSVASFELEVPGGTVEAGVLPDITISTYLNGELFDTASSDPAIDGAGFLALDLLDLGIDNARFLAGFLATAPFNAIEVKITARLVGADVGILDPNNDANIWAYDVCTEASYAPQ